MKISGHLRRICCACQRPSGNKRFHADLFKQRQVSRVIPPVMESSRPISESAFMRARSASPTVARWPARHDHDDKSPVVHQYDASHGHRPASSCRIARSEFHRRSSVPSRGLFHRGERRGADDGHPVSACAKCLLRERFTRVGDLPVGNDDFVRALFAQGFHCAKPFV